MSERKKIIYIMADNRSGSTLLENILSKSAECFSVGELAMLNGHLIKKGFGERWNWNCSCAKPFTECSFWGSIVKKLFNPENFDTHVHWQFKSKKLLITGLLPSVFKDGLIKLISLPKNKNVAATLLPLYNEVSTASGKNVIVDSSKNPLQALLVYHHLKEFDVKIIWLKRDLRAIATSKKKWKELNKRNEKPLRKLIWDVYYYRNLCGAVAKLVDKNDLLEMDYELLAKNTGNELKKVIAHTGIQPFEAPVFMELLEDHTVAGTPGRFSKKPIQYDESWKEQYKNHKMIYSIGGVLNKL
jgi:Sulfotransferase family